MRVPSTSTERGGPGGEVREGGDPDFPGPGHA